MIHTITKLIAGVSVAVALAAAAPAMAQDAAKPAGDAAQQAPAPAPATDTRPTAAFFVGGSWSAPYISPIYPSMMPE